MKKFSSLLVVSLLMLASFTAGVEYQRGDVSQDGHVDIADVTCLINYLLNGTWGDEPVTPPDEHEWVDLGLPSGTLWATCNVGASSPEEYGDYFAWGETAIKEVYDWSTYKLCDGRDSTLTKYCTDGACGVVDNKTELEPEDDAAYVNWGPTWRMPTMDQLLELKDVCSWQRAEMNGVNGALVTGPNGNTVFFPLAGARNGSEFERVGNYVYFWSTALYSDDTRVARYLYSNGTTKQAWNRLRYYGFTVRAVRVSQN
jgi:hypothetical protein